VLQCVAVCCSVLQCVAVCCSVLQCVAEWKETQHSGMLVSFQRNAAKETWRTRLLIKTWDWRMDSPNAIGCNMNLIRMCHEHTHEWYCNMNLMLRMFSTGCVTNKHMSHTLMCHKCVTNTHMSDTVTWIWCYECSRLDVSRTNTWDIHSWATNVSRTHIWVIHLCATNVSRTHTQPQMFSTWFRHVSWMCHEQTHESYTHGPRMCHEHTHEWYCNMNLMPRMFSTWFRHMSWMCHEHTNESHNHVSRTHTWVIL